MAAWAKNGERDAGILNFKHEPLNDCAYGLELADGTLWELSGDDTVNNWLGELARIMGLARVSKKPTNTIYFHGVEDLLNPSFHTKPHFGDRVSENGWKSFKNGAIHRVWRHDQIPEIHVELHQAFLDHEEIRYINMWSVLRELHRHALWLGGTPVHATLAALEGKGVLVAGAGGTRKSTCYSRFPDYWDRLCDDQALILHVGDGNFRVHPFPTWSDYLWRKSEKQWHVERSVPLQAVFFLEQASKDDVLPLNDPSEAVLKTLEAAKQVWEPVWSRVERKEKSVQSALLFDNVTRMAQTVPAYRLCATLDGKFWKEVERVFFSKEFNAIRTQKD